MKWDGVDDDVKWDDDSTLMVALIDQVVECECKVRGLQNSVCAVRASRMQ